MVDIKVCFKIELWTYGLILTQEISDRNLFCNIKIKFVTNGKAKHWIFFQIKTLFFVKIPSKIIKENILHN
jgi:hypothetical protein